MKRDENLSKIPDNWASGERYEPYVGRWSRLVAAEFLDWLSVPINSRWLDVGCGTGALSETILHTASPATVTGIDHSQAYINFARQKITGNRITFNVGSAEKLELSDGIFDAAVSGLVLNFVPHPEKAVAEMRRVTVSGGVVATYLWDYAGKMELMRYFWDAAISLDRTALELDEGRRFPLCQSQPLEKLFSSAGLRNVEVRAIDVDTIFSSFEDYWNPFLGGQGPAPSYAMSLTQEKRNELRDHIRNRLPIAEDGYIRLTARAWGVRGIK